MSRVQRMTYGLLACVMLFGIGGRLDAQVASPGLQGGVAPDQALLNLANELSANKPQALWQMLPASYQSDVQQVITGFAGKLDAELWDGTFNTAKKLTKVLKEKREMILNHPIAGAMLLNSPVPRADVEKNWDAVVEVLSTVFHSDLSTVAGLKKADVNGFLTETGGKVMTQMSALAESMPQVADANGLEKLKSMKVSIVSQDGDSAVVRVEIEGDEPKEETVVRVEGKWLPKQMADNWKESIAKVKEQIDAMPVETIAQQKADVLPVLAIVDGGLDAILAATDQDEFNTAVADLMEKVGPIFAAIGGAGAPQDADPAFNPGKDF